MSKRSLATVAVLAGLLATAAPAHAGTLVGNPGKGTAVIESIGTKYTMFFPLQVDAAKNEVATETIESPAVFSGERLRQRNGPARCTAPPRHRRRGALRTLHRFARPHVERASCAKCPLSRKGALPRRHAGVPVTGERRSRVVWDDPVSMRLDPHRDERPLTPTEDEQRIAAALVGERVLKIEYEVDADWEAAFLRLIDRTVAVAAVDVAGRSYSAPAWPWRIRLVEVTEALPAMRTVVADPGVIESIEFYERDDAEVAVAIRCDRAAAWLSGAGGDSVEAVTGDIPADLAAMRPGRRLPL